MKVSLKKVFIDPKNNYKLVDESVAKMFPGENGRMFLIPDGGQPSDIHPLISTFMVDTPDATDPIWYKKLKELGIAITGETPELEIESVDVDEFSYRQSDGTWTKVAFEDVLNDGKRYFALIDNVVKNLSKRTIKKFNIDGVNVGNEYRYNKLLGLKQPARK